MGNKPKAILVDIIPPETNKEDALKRMEELESLVETYGGVVVVKTIQKKGVPDYSTYIGKGKLEELCQMGEEHDAELLILNNLLKPSQTFNLNEILRKRDMKAWDRVDLILKIFEKHAKSTEAKLQVELASIKHMGPRIFDMGIELSRQGGAMGMRAGQGESNTEMMKRHLRRQELKILEKLEHYETIREGHRKRRKRKNFKTVSLIGYTNVGKTSLLNALTNKGAYVADELFATLDTRIGKIYIQPESDTENYEYRQGREILISDTIGFIQDLPPFLIKAFKSTLAETVESDLILHVIDITDREIHKKIQIVEEILKDLGLEDKPKIYVFNKVDKIDHDYLLRKMDSEEHGTEIELERPKGLMKAGRETAKILGWELEDERELEMIEDRVFHRPRELKAKYKKFSPVFVSAHEKIRLDRLLKAIEKKTED